MVFIRPDGALGRVSADLLTKIMSGASYDGLALRFYYLGVYAL